VIPRREERRGQAQTIPIVTGGHRPA